MWHREAAGYRVVRMPVFSSGSSSALSAAITILSITYFPPRPTTNCPSSGTSWSARVSKFLWVPDISAILRNAGATSANSHWRHEDGLPIDWHGPSDWNLRLNGGCWRPLSAPPSSGCGRDGLMSKLEIAAPGAEELPGRRQRIAVLVPCFNEEATIAKVVADFRAALPEATIYVYDNNSTDHTLEIARAAGALVRREMHQGKGNVVRRMFADVDADLYVLVDGDATYDAASVRAMILRLIEDRLDTVIAARVPEEPGAYRPGHQMGNQLLTHFFAVTF